MSEVFNQYIINVCFMPIQTKEVSVDQQFLLVK